MIITNGFKAWAQSDYACDRDLRSHTQAQECIYDSKAYHTYVISSERLALAKKSARWVGLVDSLSQVVKGTLELMLWPIVGIGLMSYSIIFIPMRLYKGQLEGLGQEIIISWMLALLYSPASTLNRVHLIAINLFGLVCPETAALQRQNSFQSFADGQSLLLFMKNVIQGNPGDLRSWTKTEKKDLSPNDVSSSIHSPSKIKPLPRIVYDSNAFSNYKQMQEDAGKIGTTYFRIKEYCTIATMQIKDSFFKEASHTLELAYQSIWDESEIESLCQIAKVRVLIDPAVIPLEFVEAIELEEMYRKKGSALTCVKALCDCAEASYCIWETNKDKEFLQKAKDYIKKAQDCFEKEKSKNESLECVMEYIEPLLYIAKTQKKVLNEDEEVLRTIEKILQLSSKLGKQQEMTLLTNISSFLISVDLGRARQIISLTSQKLYSCQNYNWATIVKERVENIASKWEAARILTPTKKTLSPHRAGYSLIY